tara:strand:+ start:185 stop:418 length:234 start_codon:yes stop_codon:yes gene_type:complete
MIFLDDFYIKMKNLMQNVKYQDFEIHGHSEEFLIKEENEKGVLIEMTQGAKHMLNTFISISEISQRGRIMYQLQQHF